MGVSAYQAPLAALKTRLMDKWLILDRDGVINYDSDEFIKSPDEWHPLPGSLEAIAALNALAYRIVVISNQSGLARGLFDLNTLHAIHHKFQTLLKQKGGQIERIYFCPHGPDDHCACRKPLPGLFNQFAKEFNVHLDGIYSVGDSVRDLEAARNSSAACVLVRTGKGKQSEQSLHALPEDDPLHHVPVYDDLASFANHLLT
jgi:D-glycero-D-manno-heptose 1,7-bisphosphate phosphatase